MGEPKRTRQHRRIGVTLQVMHESVESFRADSTENLSASGIFICTNRPLPTGTVVYMTIHLPAAQHQPVHAVGEVVWQRAAGPGTVRAGMGITFMSIKDDDRRRLDDFLAALGG